MISLLKMSDSQLIKAYKLGNELAFHTLLLRHKDKIFGFIFSKVKDSQLANDIFQDTFIKVINTFKHGNYNEEGKFLPWVMRIAHNLVIDHFRKINKVRIISENSSFDETQSVFHKISNGELNYLQKQCKEELESQMVELVEFLPESQKGIIDKRLFQGMSFKEIAEEECISINTALGRMRYALMNIRKLIQQKGIVLDF